MLLNEAKNLRTGQTIYHAEKIGADKRSVRYKVTSVKTWKTRPNQILIGLKYGLYGYEKITENDLHLVTTEAAK